MRKNRGQMPPVAVIPMKMSMRLASSSPFPVGQRLFRNFDGALDHVTGVAGGDSSPTFSLNCVVEPQFLSQFQLQLVRHGATASTHRIHPPHGAFPPGHRLSAVVPQDYVIGRPLIVSVEQPDDKQTDLVRP
jgi:hypothetical protein